MKKYLKVLLMMSMMLILGTQAGFAADSIKKEVKQLPRFHYAMVEVTNEGVPVIEMS